MRKSAIIFLLCASCGVAQLKIPKLLDRIVSDLRDEGGCYQLRMGKVSDFSTDIMSSVRVALENCQGALLTDENLQTEVVLGISSNEGYRELQRGHTSRGVVVFHLKFDNMIQASLLHAEATIAGKVIHAEGGPFNVEQVENVDYFVYPRRFSKITPGQLFTIYLIANQGDKTFQEQDRHWLQVYDRAGEKLEGALAMWNEENLYNVVSTTASAPKQNSLLPQEYGDKVIATFEVFFTEQALKMDVARIAGHLANGSQALGASIRMQDNSSRITMSANYDEEIEATLFNFSENPNPKANDPLRIQDIDKITYISTADDSGKVEDSYQGKAVFSGKNSYGFWLFIADFSCSIDELAWVKVNDRVYQSSCL